MSSSWISAHVHEAFHGCRWEQGSQRPSHEIVASETAVALFYNCSPYVVMMATPSNLDDFVLGFSLSECIIGAPQQLLRVGIRSLRDGVVVNGEIPVDRFRDLDRKQRNLEGRTGCGLCGAQTLAQAMRRPPRVDDTFRIAPESLQRGIADLAAKQPINAETGSVHAAASIDAYGRISCVREDVGRHNALDKLIGAMIADGVDPADRAVLITSRASSEMVQKTATVGIQMLCAISAPTTLAIRMAQDSGVTLVAFARNNRHTVYAHAQRMTPAPRSRSGATRAPTSV